MQKQTVVKVGLTALVALGGVGFLLYSSSQAAAPYEMVDKLIAKGIDNYKTKPLKAHGFVRSGSYVASIVGQQERGTFIAQKEGKAIRVFFTGPPPDTFDNESEVVALGRLVPAAEMQTLATQICAKPTNKTAAAATHECPIRADAEQTLVVDATELSAKCPSKYEGARTNKIDTNFK